MVEDNNNVSTEQTGSETSTGTIKTEYMIPKPRLDQELQKVQELQSKLTALQNAQAEQNAAKLLEEKRFEELYNNAQTKIESLTNAQTLADSYKASLIATNQARIDRVPEDKRSLVPDYEDPVKMGTWLDANANLFTETPKPIAPSLDGGAGGQSSVTSADIVKLTPLEQQYADASNMSYEDMALGKANRGKPIT